MSDSRSERSIEPQSEATVHPSPLIEGQQAERLEVLRQVVRGVNETAEAADALRLLMPTFRRINNACRMAVFDYQAETRKLDCMAHSDELRVALSQQEIHKLRTRFSLTELSGTRFERCIHDRQPLYTADLRVGAEDGPATLLGNGILSEVLVPLVSAQRVLGVMAVGKPTPEGFDEDERRFFAAVGESLAAAMAKSDLLAAAKEALCRREAIRQLQSYYLATRDLEGTLDRAVRAVAEIEAVDLVKILWLDADGRRLTLRAGVGWQEGQVGQAKVSAGEGSQAGYTLQTRKPVIVDDLARETRFTGPALLVEHGVVSGYSVPITIGDAVVGVMGAHHRLHRHFGAEQTEFLAEMANVVCLATDDARLIGALRASEERFRRFSEASFEGIVVIEDARVVDSNDLFAKMFDYEPSEVAGKTVLDFVAAEDRELVLTNIMSGYEEPYELTCVKRDGSSISLEVCGRQVEHESGKSTLMAVRDIGARKRAEAARRKTEGRYRTLFEGLRDAVYIITQDGHFVDFNQSTLALFGYAREEMHGLEFSDLFLDPGGHQRFQQEMLQHGSVREFEVKLRKKDGTELDCVISSTERQASETESSILFYQGIIHDVTGRKHAERALHESEEQLRHAQKMDAVGRLAGGVAHDFNNLLTGISGYTQLLLNDVEEGSSTERDLGEILRCASRASDLTRQLLAFSRKQPLQVAVINLNDMLENTSKMLERLLGEDIELEFLSDPDLGNVEADPGQIEQVLVNLAVNARDAMSSGGKLTIETSNVVLDSDYALLHAEAEVGPHVMLAVTDTGCGMDQETQQRIFEPFFTTKDKDKGTGLGLATVYGIVKQHGGNVWVYTEPGKGTTFKVYLPRVESDARALAAEEKRRPLPRGSETILVVEDEQSVRAVVERALEAQGYKVLTAQHPQEAEQTFTEHAGEIALLVTDVVMPGADGQALYRRLSTQEPSLKILYMSGYTDRAILRHGGLDPSMPFIQKPFGPREIVRKVHEVLNGLPGAH
ncbi:MAG: PAS domain S-box protein [Acidobacteriota bacterium]